MSEVWDEYLDALGRYVDELAPALARGRLAARPAALASRPAGAVPQEHAESAQRLLGELSRLGAVASARRDEVLSALRVVASRQRVLAPRVGRRVDSPM